MKATLNVPGVDSARIVCRTDRIGRQMVLLDGGGVATMWGNGSVEFSGMLSCESEREECHAVMNACIDHWRATGRLFPEPTPEPVECVCGGKPKLCSSVDLPVAFVVCIGVSCNLRANTVAQWNTIQAALKAAKK